MLLSSLAALALLAVQDPSTAPADGQERREASGEIAAYARIVEERAAKAASEAPASLPEIETPASALRDPYGWVLSQCSPLVLPRTADPAACEARHWAALRSLNPEIGGPRPASTAIGAPDAPAQGSLFNGRCRTRQSATRDENGSSASGRIVCGDDSPAAQALLDGLLR